MSSSHPGEGGEGASSGRARHWLAVLAADGLAVPAGLLILVYLTRRLGPAGYGLFILASSVILWVEWSIGSLFGRAALKLMSEAEDWRATGASVLRLELLLGCTVGIGVAALAGPAAAFLGAPELGPLIRIFALDLPFFLCAQGYRNIMVSRARYPARAFLAAMRQLVRAGLLVLLVELGFGITGAVAAVICASAAEVLLGWWGSRVSPFGPAKLDYFELWRYAIPTFLFAASLRLFDKVDLFMLKRLGGSIELAGIYGAAQRISAIPVLVAMSLAPLLLASMTRLESRGMSGASRWQGGEALRLAILQLPFVAIVSSSAAPLVTLVLGEAYAGAAPVMSLLVFAGMGQVIVQMGASILISQRRPALTFAIVAPLVPLSAALQWLVIPHYGAAGAATVTTVLAVAAAVATLIASAVSAGCRAPVSTWVWTLLLGAAAVLVSSHWTAAGWELVGKILVLGAGTAAVLVASGQLKWPPRRPEDDS